MAAPWTPDFDVYERRANQRRVLLLVDLAARPVASHPQRLTVRVELQRPRADGLRDDTELEAFSAVEDAIVETVEGLSGLFLGRFTVGGAVVFLFHLPDAQAAAAKNFGKLLPEVSPYAPGWQTAPDPAWELWREALQPDDLEQQTIRTRRLLRVFAENGDDLAAPRKVDHVALFEAEEAAQAAARDLAAKGFAIDGLTSTEEGEDESWALAFSRVDPLDERIYKAVAELLDVVLEHEGQYDGWGAPTVKKE